MRCLVINLDRSPDRLAHVAAEFSRIGIAFERVAAVDGRERPEISKMSPSLTLPEIGCFLSHRACWSLIAKGDDAYGAIFEDDVVLTETAGQLLADESWIPDDADVVKVETVFRKAVISMKRVPAGKDYALHRLYGLHLGSGGYVISKQAARELLEATQGNDTAIDHVLFDPALATSSRRVIYQISPALCAQTMFLRDKANEFPSEIQKAGSTPAQKRDQTKQRSKAPLAKFAVEANRIWRQLFDICRLRREKTISFSYRGAPVRSSLR